MTRIYFLGHPILAVSLAKKLFRLFTPHSTMGRLFFHRSA